MKSHDCFYLRGTIKAQERKKNSTASIQNSYQSNKLFVSVVKLCFLFYAWFKRFVALKRLRRSVTMNFFEKNYFLFKSFVKIELSYVLTINISVQLKTAWKSELSYKNVVIFRLLGIIYVPPVILDIWFLT